MMSSKGCERKRSAFDLMLDILLRYLHEMTEENHEKHNFV